MILVAMLGMSPKVAFPIMMGSCAFLMGVFLERREPTGGLLRLVVGIDCRLFDHCR
jgi:hypothetical protein